MNTLSFASRYVSMGAPAESIRTWSSTLGVFYLFDSCFWRTMTNSNNRHTPIAWINKFILVHIPNAILALDKLLTGGRLTSGLYRCGNFMVYDRHPTVLVSATPCILHSSRRLTRSPDILLPPPLRLRISLPPRCLASLRPNQ